MWYSKEWSTPPFDASSSSHTQSKAQGPQLFGIWSYCNSSLQHSCSPLQQKWKIESGNSTEVDGLISSYISQVSEQTLPANISLDSQGVTYVTVWWFVHWNCTVFLLPCGLSNVSPKLDLYSLFCCCLFLWMISHLREWVSSKCSTLEHAEANRAKSKLCNWILRGWLGIADLAVIKTTLFTLVLHHSYSKTADWPQMYLYNQRRGFLLRPDQFHLGQRQVGGWNKVQCTRDSRSDACKVKECLFEWQNNCKHK